VAVRQPGFLRGCVFLDPVLCKYVRSCF
jgi:hypothetical protein